MNGPTRIDESKGSLAELFEANKTPSHLRDRFLDLCLSEVLSWPGLKIHVSPKITYKTTSDGVNFDHGKNRFMEVKPRKNGITIYMPLVHGDVVSSDYVFAKSGLYGWFKFKSETSPEEFKRVARISYESGKSL